MIGLSKAGFGGSAASRGARNWFAHTALGVSLGIVVAGAGGAGAAMAADECGAEIAGPDTVVCSGASYPDGIDYAAVDDLTIVVPGSVTIDGGLSVGGAGQIVISGEDTTIGNSLGAGADVYSENGAVSVDLGSVTTSGDGAFGVVMSAALDGLVETNSVTTSGEAATGILAGAGGDLVVLGGQIVTEGDYAAGIVAVSKSGGVAVYASAATAGDHAAGIIAEAGSGYAVVVDGDVTTQGDFSDAVYASGDRVLVMTFDARTTGDHSNGIEAVAGGDVTVQNGQEVLGGFVYTDGDGSVAIEALSASGQARVYSQTIRTTGDDSAGIVAVARAGDVYVSNGFASSYGVIVTNGNDSDGIVAYASGQATIGSDFVSTQGERSQGVLIIAGGDVLATSVSVTTEGGYSAGIAVVSDHGDIAVSSQYVDTAGNSSDGLNLNALSGSAQVDQGKNGYAGAIITQGVDSDGIDAFGALGVYISNQDVQTYGDLADGIRAVSGGAVEAGQITVTTAGDYAIGLFALSQDGVKVQGADISTNGLFSTGIWAVAQRGDISIESDQVQTGFNGSAGILARAYDGSITIASDHLSTYGAASTAMDLAASADIVITSAAIVTQGVRSGGIIAQAGGDASVVSGGVHTYGELADGVYVTAYGDIAIVSDRVTAEGPRSAGIIASSYAGSVTVTSEAVTSASVGIYASGLEVTVDAGTTSTTGEDAFGLVAVGGAYYSEIPLQVSASVRADSVATDGYFSFGVYVSAAGGDALVDVGRIETRGDLSLGILEVARLGDAELSLNSVMTSGVSSAAVEVTTIGGDAWIDVGSATTYGDASGGLLGYASRIYDPYLGVEVFGDLHMQAGSIETWGAQSPGLVGVTNAGDADISVVQVITHGDYSDGVAAMTTLVSPGLHRDPYVYAGDLNVAAGVVATYGAASVGIETYSQVGSISVEAGSVATAGDDAIGIRATTAYQWRNDVLYSGDVKITVGSVTTAGAGADAIYALTHYGEISISAGDVSAAGVGANGVTAITEGSGDVLIDLSGDTFAAGGSAIYVRASGSAVITIGPSQPDEPHPQVFGRDAGITIDTAGGAVININGTLSSGSGLAIAATGGAVTINNMSNTVDGFVQLTGMDDRFNNAGTWRVSGVSDFGLGEDRIDNSGLLFLAPGTAQASTVRLDGLESFHNSGVIDLVNGQAGDLLDMGKAAFDGAGLSTIRLDIGTRQGSSAVDSLMIGSVTGTTRIELVRQGGFGQLGATSVVHLDGANTAGAFSLQDGHFDAGLVDLTLSYDDAAHAYVLVGTPDSEAGEVVGFVGASQDFWRRSTDAWSARRQAARDAGDRAPDTGIETWAQAYAGDQGLDPGLDGRSAWTGFQAGVEAHRAGGLVGFTFGYADQRSRFDQDGNTLALTGMQFGGYAEWTRAAAFLNLMVKAGTLHGDADLRSAGFRAEADGHTLGGVSQVGMHLAAGGGFLEPMAEISWAQTDLGPLRAPGAVFDGIDGQSTRARIGARAGATVHLGRARVAGFLGAFAVDELGNTNHTRLETGSTFVDLTGEATDPYAQLDFGLTASGLGGLVVIVNGDADLGASDGLSVRMGATWQW